MNASRARPAADAPCIVGEHKNTARLCTREVLIAHPHEVKRPRTAIGPTRYNRYVSPPIYPTCGHPASEAIGGREHEWESGDAAGLELGQPPRVDEPPSDEPHAGPSARAAHKTLVLEPRARRRVSGR
jgi:hypothetical protein